MAEDERMCNGSRPRPLAGQGRGIAAREKPIEAVGPGDLKSGDLGRQNLQRVHSMATNSSQPPPRQAALPVGTAPVMSSRSTLRKDAAWLKSRDLQ